MKALRVIEVIALVLLGICVDRFWLRPESSISTPVDGRFAAWRTEGSRDSIGSHAAAPAPVKHRTEAERSATEQAARLAEKSVEVRVERAKNEKSVLSEQAEARMSDLLSTPMPRSAKPGEKVNSDGSVDVYGLSDDGKKFYRHFDPKGELTKEGWTDDPGGEDVHRTYYESGQLKAMYWNRRDGTKTSIGFTQAGLTEYRWERLTDGTEISFNYDDSGQVKDVWRRGADGKSVRVD